MCLSFYPSVLSGGFLGIDSLVFSDTQHGARGPCVIVRGRARFFEKIFLSKKWGKWTKNGKKWGFLNLLENLVIIFFQDLVYNESFRYLLYSCTNPIFGKNLVPGIWVKMLLASQITRFLNQLYF